VEEARALSPVEETRALSPVEEALSPVEEARALSPVEEALSPVEEATQPTQRLESPAASARGDHPSGAHLDRRMMTHDAA
jgi:hypothetical protein